MSLSHSMTSQPKKQKPSFSSFSAAFGQPLTKPKEEPKEVVEMVVQGATKEKQSKNEFYFKGILQKLAAFQADFAEVKRELALLKSVVHEIHRAV